MVCLLGALFFSNAEGIRLLPFPERDSPAFAEASIGSVDRYSISVKPGANKAGRSYAKKIASAGAHARPFIEPLRVFTAVVGSGLVGSSGTTTSLSRNPNSTRGSPA